jgi:hypothetical protein
MGPFQCSTHTDTHDDARLAAWNPAGGGRVSYPICTAYCYWRFPLQVRQGTTWGSQLNSTHLQLVFGASPRSPLPPIGGAMSSERRSRMAIQSSPAVGRRVGSCISRRRRGQPAAARRGLRSDRSLLSLPVAKPEPLALLRPSRPGEKRDARSTAFHRLSRYRLI